MSSQKGFFFILLVASLLLLESAWGNEQCRLVFLFRSISEEVLVADPRQEYEVLEKTQTQPLLKIGEGNSASIYLQRHRSGFFEVIKVYKEERKDALQRDHLGLLEIKSLFELDKGHLPQLKVAASEIREISYNSEKTKVLVMPYVAGVNLHKFLVSTSLQNPLRQKAIDLYNQMITELHQAAQRMGFQDEVRVESHQYFQDKQVDGLLMLRIYGFPHLLIKTDNLIFNPQDGSLTLIDPY
jgi:serine/threonine protein kinase